MPLECIYSILKGKFLVEQNRHSHVFMYISKTTFASCSHPTLRTFFLKMNLLRHTNGSTSRHSFPVHTTHTYFGQNLTSYGNSTMKATPYVLLCNWPSEDDCNHFLKYTFSPSSWSYVTDLKKKGPKIAYGWLCSRGYMCLCVGNCHRRQFSV